MFGKRENSGIGKGSRVRNWHRESGPGGQKLGKFSRVGRKHIQTALINTARHKFTKANYNLYCFYSDLISQPTVTEVIALSNF